MTLPETKRGRRNLDGGSAAIDRKDRAMDETGAVGCQEHDRLGNLLRRGRASGWRLRRELLQGVAHCSRTFGAGRSGTDRIDAHALGSIFGCPRLGQQIDGSFARSIEAQARSTVIGDHRRDVDDCALASLRHQRGKFGDEEEGRSHIERIDVVEYFLGHFMRRTEWKHAGVINQHVDMVVCQFDGLFRDRARARGIAQVGRDEIGFAARRPYFGDRAFAAFLVAAHHDDTNAGLRQFVGCRAADTARRSGDKGCRGHGRLLVSFTLAAGLMSGSAIDGFERVRAVDGGGVSDLYAGRMNDRFRELTAFVRAGETGSFSRVARELGVSQPSISRMVADLEARLGVKLLLRTTRHVAPTDAGRVFLERARQILGDLDDAENAARGADGLRGTLRVALSGAFGIREVIPRLPDFVARYPKLGIELLMSDRTEDLIAEGADIALRLGPLPDSGFGARLLGKAPRLLIASPGYIARKGLPRTLADLAGHDCILGPGLSGRSS